MSAILLSFLSIEVVFHQASSLGFGSDEWTGMAMAKAGVSIKQKQNTLSSGRFMDFSPV